MWLFSTLEDAELETVGPFETESAAEAYGQRFLTNKLDPFEHEELGPDPSFTDLKEFFVDLDLDAFVHPCEPPAAL